HTLPLHRQAMEGEETAEEAQQAPSPLPRPMADEEAVQTQRWHVQRTPLQRTGPQMPPPRVTPSLAANIHALNGSGSRLPDTPRAFFEPRFGADFSQVRVHTDSRFEPPLVDGGSRLGALRDLQLAAGNAAVATLLAARGRSRSPPSGPAGAHAQRYISSEHKELGEAATGRMIALDLWVGPPEPFIKTRKVILTYGDVNALLGDYYDGWSQLKRAPAREVEQLVALFKRERDAVAAKKPLPSEAEYEQATAGRKGGTGQPGAATKAYLELAEENVVHFAPDNRDRFAKQHKEALKRGVEAFNLRAKGKTAEADAAEADAFLINAEADHFMQDAFAAGHLMSKPLIQLAT